VEFIVKELQGRPRPGEKIQLPNGESVRVRHVGIPWIQPPMKVCNDPQCPWHGHLKVRSRIMICTVVSVKGRVATVMHTWYHYDPKYKRYERRRRNIHVRLPPCIDVNVGDVVYVGETRPLSKTIAHVILGRREDVIAVKPIVQRLEGSQGS